eukprot:scaffold1275_cov401-Prasinococcus_capsulatus_cf.AAC.6
MLAVWFQIGGDSCRAAHVSEPPKPALSICRCCRRAGENLRPQHHLTDAWLPRRARGAAVGGDRGEPAARCRASVLPEPAQRGAGGGGDAASWRATSAADARQGKGLLPSGRTKAAALMVLLRGRRARVVWTASQPAHRWHQCAGTLVSMALQAAGTSHGDLLPCEPATTHTSGSACPPRPHPSPTRCCMARPRRLGVGVVESILTT